MPSLTSYGHIKCAASNTRLAEAWSEYGVEYRSTFEGDVVLVEALGDTGAYAEIENMTGRSESLHRGDLFLAVMGNRESSTYLCGGVPPDGLILTPDSVLHLLSNGGIVGIAAKCPAYLGEPLRLRCHGVLTRAGNVVNTIKRPNCAPTVTLRPLILVAASSTNAGKTTLASRLVASLYHHHSLLVAAAKLAGTGCLEDILQHRDAGAAWVADFPDVGLPSTYTDSANYMPAVRSLLQLLSGNDPDVIVAELGGDLIWANIPTLFSMTDVMAAVLGIVIIPTDVLSAIGIDKLLHEWAVTAPVVWAIPPNRNPTSFKLRMDAFVPGELLDTRNIDDIQELASRFATQLPGRALAAGPAMHSKRRPTPTSLKLW